MTRSERRQVEAAEGFHANVELADRADGVSLGHVARLCAALEGEPGVVGPLGASADGCLYLLDDLALPRCRGDGGVRELERDPGIVTAPLRVVQCLTGVLHGGGSTIAAESWTGPWSCTGKRKASIHQDRGELDQAMELQLEREQTCRSIENPDQLLSALGDQAMLCLGRDDAPRAFALLEEHEAICRRLGGREESMAWSLALLGFLRRASGDRATGDANLEEASAIARDSGKPQLIETVERLNAIDAGAAE